MREGEGANRTEEKKYVHYILKLRIFEICILQFSFCNFHFSFLITKVCLVAARLYTVRR